MNSGSNGNFGRGSARASSFRRDDVDFIRMRGIFRRFQAIARWEELIKATQEVMMPRKKLGHPFHHFHAFQTVYPRKYKFDHYTDKRWRLAFAL